MRTTNPGNLGSLGKAESNTGSCSLETLARSRVLHVQRCSHCNTLSLHFGPLTVRFDPESAEGLWNTLGEALMTLHARREQENRELAKLPSGDPN
jgi:hypothetical protein